MRVAEVMTRGAECVLPTTSLQEAAQRMKALNVGSLPVCEDDRLVGMVTDRDITIRATSGGGDPSGVTVRDVMSPGVVYVFEDQDVAEAAKVMRDRQIRRLVVLNRDRRLVGIVSLGDLAVETADETLAGNTLEEVSRPTG